MLQAKAQLTVCQGSDPPSLIPPGSQPGNVPSRAKNSLITFGTNLVLFKLILIKAASVAQYQNI